jgi:Holliday junction resolvase
LSRYARKVDTAQGPIVDALRAAGCSVVSTAALGKGAPDILVGLRGRNVLMEIKTPKAYTKKKTAVRQVVWHVGWAGEVHVVRTPEEALAVMGLAMPSKFAKPHRCDDPYCCPMGRVG